MPPKATCGPRRAGSARRGTRRRRAPWESTATSRTKNSDHDIIIIIITTTTTTTHTNTTTNNTNNNNNATATSRTAAAAPSTCRAAACRSCAARPSWWTPAALSPRAANDIVITILLINIGILMIYDNTCNSNTDATTNANANTDTNTKTNRLHVRLAGPLLHRDLQGALRRPARHRALPGAEHAARPGDGPRGAAGVRVPSNI